MQNMGRYLPASHPRYVRLGPIYQTELKAAPAGIEAWNSGLKLEIGFGLFDESLGTKNHTL